MNHESDRRPLTSYQAETLRDLCGLRDGAWVRLMDLGAWDGSHHSASMRALIKRGLAERKEVGGSISQIRKTYRYRSTREGRELSEGLESGRTTA